MKHVAGVVLGIAAGIALCALWFAVAWLWKNYGWNIANLIANPRDDRSHLGLLELVPPIAGAFILYVGISASITLLPSDKISVRTYAWAASMICALVTLIFSGLMFFMSYTSSGAVSFLMAGYGLAMLVIPGSAIYFGARSGLESAQ